MDWFRNCLGKKVSIKCFYDNPCGRHLLTDDGLCLNQCLPPWNEVVKPGTWDEKLEDCPSRAAYVRSIPFAKVFKQGLLLQGCLVSTGLLKNSDNFLIRPDDVFICSYPKSGTTSTEQILSLISNNSNIEETNEIPLFFRVFHYEVGRPAGQLSWLNGLKSPRLLATHLPYEYTPLLLQITTCKIIYVARNPKDTAISYFYHHKSAKYLGNYKGSLEEFIELFLNESLVYGSWFQHVKSYWNLAKQAPDKVLFISYEELIVDLPKMVRIIAEFLGKVLDGNKLERIVDQCTFKAMSQNPRVNREKTPVNDIFNTHDYKFMRKGVIGDWVNHFTPHMNDTFNACLKKKMSDCKDLRFAFTLQEAIEFMDEDERIVCLKDPKNSATSEDVICSQSK